MAYQFPSTSLSNANAGAYRDPRVSFLLQPGETLIQCTYDKSHWVRSNKLLGHLVKCRHNYNNAIKNGTIKITADSKIIICPFNSTHHLPQGEMRNHLENICSSNPFTKDDFFQKLDEEKYRRDKIAWDEKRAIQENPSSGVAAGRNNGGDAKNSAFDFLEIHKNPEFPETKLQCGPQQPQLTIKMEKEENPAEIGGLPLNLKQEFIKQEVKCVKEENIGRGRGSSRSTSRASCGSRSSSRGSQIAAEIMRIAKEEREQEKENVEWVRPGNYPEITTPYKNKKPVKKIQQEFDERGLTEEMRTDPDHNWDLVLPTNDGQGQGQLLKRFTTYDPTKYLTFEKNRDRTFIQNPQGLTKSERKAYHLKQAEEERRREEERSASGVARAIRKRMEAERETDLDDAEPPPITVEEGRRTPTTRGTPGPTYPGYELNLDMQLNSVEEYQKRRVIGHRKGQSQGR